MNIQSLLKNWKTTTAGLASIMSGIALLIAAIKSKSTDPTAYTPACAALVAGLGLLFAGDADKSAKKEDAQAIAVNVNAIKNAVTSGNTEHITRADLPAMPATPPVEPPKT